MGGGGFMQHAGNTNKKDRAQRAARRDMYGKKDPLLSNDRTNLDFSHLTPKEIENERKRLKLQFEANKKKKRNRYIVAGITTITILFILLSFKKINFNPSLTVGQPLDSLNSVVVYYNGGVGNVEKRNTIDGYNLGLEYQCVEYVKRYYYEVYNHKMPDSYGHAKSFFAPFVKDGELNGQRGLKQYTNSSKFKPQIGDLLVMDGTLFNSYGHVAIISMVTEDQVEIIQQNPGPFQPSRISFELQSSANHYHILDKRILGWLRK